MKTFTENYSQSKFRVVKSTGNAYTYKIFPTPKTQGTMQKRQRKEWKRQRNMDFIVNFGFLVISQSTSIKSYQLDCPNMICIRTILMN